MQGYIVCKYLCAHSSMHRGSVLVLVPVCPIGFVPLEKLDKLSYQTSNEIY